MHVVGFYASVRDYGTIGRKSLAQAAAQTTTTTFEVDFNAV